ncbi:MAG: hypothetical protein LBD24_02165 [Spirochaetaceae bacterium]|nr:hypothetical protein [Spirochaetaceae bacterium]
MKPSETAAVPKGIPFVVKGIPAVPKGIPFAVKGIPDVPKGRSLDSETLMF